MSLEDPLYRIFEEHLHSGLYDEAPVEMFVRDVVDYYWFVLHREGHVPQPVQERLKNELGMDVHEMLKAKTYGFYGISEYNKGRKTG